MYIKFKYSIEDDLQKIIYKLYLLLIYTKGIKILDVDKDIKQNITDNQYKTIMDSLMEVNKISKFKY